MKIDKLFFKKNVFRMILDSVFIFSIWIITKMFEKKYKIIVITFQIL